MDTENKTNDSTSSVTKTEAMTTDASQINSEEKILSIEKVGENKIVSELIENVDVSDTVPAVEGTNVLSEGELKIVDGNTKDNVNGDELKPLSVSDMQDPSENCTKTDVKTNDETKNSSHDSLENISDKKEHESAAAATIEKLSESTEEGQLYTKMSKEEEVEYNKKVEEEVAALEKSVENQKSTVTFETSDEKDEKVPSRLQPLPENSAKKFETVFPAPQHQSNTLTVIAKKPVNKNLPQKFVYDPNKISIKFLFANRDGLFVTCDCAPSDTVGDVKGVLMSLWPDELPTCTGGDRIRLICMGKGLLMPDTRTLNDCEVPVFKTHPTPVNVSLKPSPMLGSGDALKKNSYSHSTGNSSDRQTTETVGTTCSCVIL